MTRRGLFGAVLGGLAAATGLRALGGAPLFVPGSRIVFRKTAGMGKTESAFQLADDATALPGLAPWRTTSAPTCDVLRLFERAEPNAPEPTSDTADAPPTAPVDLPTVWPGVSGEITATASLPPFAQVKRLNDLFSQSGDGAPAFAAALIGELVLTRMRLAAADPRTLCTLTAELP